MWSTTSTPDPANTGHRTAQLEQWPPDARNHCDGSLFFVTHPRFNIPPCSLWVTLLRLFSNSQGIRKESPVSLGFPKLKAKLCLSPTSTIERIFRFLEAKKKKKKKTNVYCECKWSGQVTDKGLRIFSVMVSSWRWGSAETKYRGREPAHPAVWMLPHHAGGEEKVPRLAILEEAGGSFHQPLPSSPSPLSSRLPFIEHWLWPEPGSNHIFMTLHDDLTRLTSSVLLVAFIFPYVYHS